MSGHQREEEEHMSECCTVRSTGTSEVKRDEGDIVRQQDAEAFESIETAATVAVKVDDAGELLTRSLAGDRFVVAGLDG